MAESTAVLDDAQKTTVKKYLGYPLDSIAIDSRLGVVDGDFQTEVESILTELTDIDSRLNGISRDVAGLTAVSSVQFARGQNIKDLELLGNRLVSRLAFSLGVDVLQSPYGGTRPSGPGLMFFA